MRRTSVLVAVLGAVALVAGCSSDGGSGSSGTPSATPTSSTAAPTTSSAPETTAAATSSAETSAASSVGAAPAGTSLKAGAASRFPASLGGFAKQGESGPATIYSKDGNLVSLSLLSGSNYELISKNVTQQRTVAGTGICGSTSEPTNLTCYLRADDGVLNISADAGDVPLAELVSFTNQLTAAVGFS